MFYSHTILARKGPLGTVWCAAHLQHKLKKSYYTSTNIPSTIERILYPEVPIALRMSGHLLLGVVRIYSKQVEYLYQDCNGVLTGISKAFSTVSINLPEDATQAPVDTITFPETFQLDALAIEDVSFLESCEDNHLRMQEDIMLQVLTGSDQYIVITFDEDINRDLVVIGDATGSGVNLTQEDSWPSVPEETTAALGDPSTSNWGGLNEKTVGNSTTQQLPEIEFMRDAVNDFRMEDALIWPDQGNDVLEPDRVLEELIMRDKEASSPVVREILALGGPSVPSHQPEEPQSVASQRVHESFDLHIALEHSSPRLAMCITPPNEQSRAKQRKRRRQFYFDENTVLTNKSMKKALEDSSDLLRKTRNCPSSSLDIWKLENRLKKECVFLEPLMTGLFADIDSIYKKEVVSSKPHLVTLEGPHPQSRVKQSPTHRDHSEMEIEHLRDYEGPPGGSPMLEILPSLSRFGPSPSMSMPSIIRTNESTPATMNVGSETDWLETTIGTDVQPTPDLAASSGLFGTDSETPATHLSKALGVENTVLSDIPEMANSAGDLNFLEQDDNTPGGCLGTPESGHLTKEQRGAPEFDKLSARTRAVAMYLRRQSSITPNSEELSRSLSLNSILEGKNYKICARMFSEMLVLKNYELVDVKQEDSYGDITLKVTLKLSEEQFQVKCA